MTEQKLNYRLLTGPDDTSFCERVSEALAEGYELHGSPAITSTGNQIIVAQAVILRNWQFLAPESTVETL